MKLPAIMLSCTVLLLALNACAVAPAATLHPTLLPPGEGFAIYLLASPSNPGDILNADLRTLVLADSPFITTADLVRYDRATHSLQLTPSAFARVKALPRAVSGPPFVVCVDRQPVYGGSFWTSLSSASFAGVVIDTLRGGQENEVLRLQLGYPESLEIFKGQDPRSDPRVLQSLSAAGKLDESR